MTEQSLSHTGGPVDNGQPLGPYVYSVTLTDGTRMHTPDRSYAITLVEITGARGLLAHYDIAGH